MTPAEWTAGWEGDKLVAYQDQGGVWTIGRGHTGPGIVEGLVWTQAESDAAFAKDCHLAACNALEVIGLQIDAVRMGILQDMAFQLGRYGLGGFKHMLAALRLGDWAAAKAECLTSRYARQTPDRAKANAEVLLTGIWPDAHPNLEAVA